MNIHSWLQHVFTNNNFRLYIAGFVAVILLSIAVSGYKLGAVPHGLTWDEAAIGYNGYAILNTRRDEWLVKLPASFRSFGDYKAPLPIYINGVFTKIFGLNSFGIRLPFMLAGVMSVIGIMLLVELLWRDEKDRFLYSVLAGMVMVTTPWYVHYSRTGFESGMALCLTIWGVYFFFLFRRYHTIWPFLLSMISFVLSLYTYHSSKLVTPLLVVTLLLYSWKDIFQRKNLKRLIGVGIAACVLAYPLLIDSVYGHGLERAGVSLFSRMSFGDALLQMVKQFGQHLMPGFLINGETTTLRHGDGVWGVLLLPTYLVLLAGISWIILKWKSLESGDKHIFMISSAWLVMAILPAAMASDAPHSNRASLALPAFIVLAIWSISALAKRYNTEFFKRTIIGSVILFQTLFFVGYIKDYFTVFASASADDFQDGYLEAFELARQYEHGVNGKPEVEKIIFASDYGQPYIYALLVRKTNPILYQGGSLFKYEFRDDVAASDLKNTNTLVVAAADDDLGKVQPNHIIMGSDDKPKFKVYLTSFR